MSRSDRFRTPSWLRTLACAALAVLALGTAAHLWHHLSDPACESEPGGLHPCTACSSLHAAAVVEDGDVAPPPLPEAEDSNAGCPTIAQPQVHAPAGFPRAPPSS